MKHGDFTTLAKYYVDRPGYSTVLLEYIKAYLQGIGGSYVVTADIGAGTGKLTENLEQIGCRGYAVEPNDAMRQEGEKLFQERKSFSWLKGTLEEASCTKLLRKWFMRKSRI